jgi:hypothetical protein
MERGRQDVLGSDGSIAQIATGFELSFGVRTCSHIHSTSVSGDDILMSRPSREADVNRVR